MFVNLTIAILLLVANGFFVAAEFALVKLKSFRIDALAESGNGTAKLTQSIHRNLEPYLAACQLGITMASLGLGWVGEPTVAALLEPLLHPLGLSEKLVHTIAFLTGFIVFSSLHIVVGEQVPKTFAIRKPELVAMWIAYPLRAFYLLIFPLNWVLNAASSAILRMFGVAEASHAEVLSGEEIQGLIETSEQYGNIESDKATMLNNMFEFDSRTVEEIMVPRGNTAYIDLQDPWEQQFETLSKIEHSRFPVVDGGDQYLTGIILAKDLYRRTLSGDHDLKDKLRELIRDPLVVPESQTIGVLFEVMRTARQHMAVVIDEYGSFAGVVTMEDLLEEIVGEIADELDQTSDEAILTKRGGTWEASGWTQLGDIERTLQIQFEEDVDANTLSGLLMFRLTRIPETGDSIVEQGFQFTVKSMDGRRVNLVTIEVADQAEDGNQEVEDMA
ncbi:MAG: CBS domain containing-hemolysin-like protein [Verrucomicrobiales bacterium]|jgi:CBS domain containing-hemolysin-like protein